MKITTTISVGAAALLLCVPGLQAQQRHAHRAEIPHAMRTEHAAIMSALEAAAQQPGDVGAAARELHRVLYPHFLREEQIALPPLGVLRRLLDSDDIAGMDWLLPMTDSLRAELPRMLDEHKTIGRARLALVDAARRAGNQEVLQLGEELGRHAQSEEELFYPMAVLVGEVVRSRMKCAH